MKPYSFALLALALMTGSCQKSDPDSVPAACALPAVTTKAP